MKNDFSFVRPPKGWIKAIREALGMTTKQLGSRIGVSQSRAYDIEKAEANGSITLDSLERAANALDCKLVYTLVPRKSLEEMVQDQALKIAKQNIQSIHHTMSLENQNIDETDEKEQVAQLAKQLSERSGSNLWKDN